MTIGWQEYLELLDDAVRRVEIELAIHPGSFQPIPDPSSFGEPEGQLPMELGTFAQDLRSRMGALTLVIEDQMAQLEAHRNTLANEQRAGYADLQSVFIDTRV